LPAVSYGEFVQVLDEILNALRAAKRNRASLSSHSFYSTKVRSALATLRKCFLTLQRDYPSERYPAVAFQLASIEPLLQNMISLYPASATEMLKLADEIAFKVHSDLSAHVEAPPEAIANAGSAPYIPNDLIEERHFVLKKILWEVNRCYDSACYNSCAAMIRRLVESLIVQAFERLGIGDKIKKHGDYVDFAELIGKATAESRLGLTRNTKRVLPQLKFFGDLGAHNRNALVRKDDLDRLHEAARSAIEELVRSI
jgi:Domain of unknown function (DUF4145)